MPPRHPRQGSAPRKILGANWTDRSPILKLKDRIASDLERLGAAVTTARVTLERLRRPQLSEAQPERRAANP
jgi:hypothetical protein